MTLGIISALSRGVVRAAHTDDTAPAGSGSSATSSPAGGGSGDGAAKPRRKTLAEKLDEKKLKKGRIEKTRPILRKLGNDFARTLGAPTRDVVMVDSRNWTDDGVYCLSEEVQEHLMTMRRQKVMFEAEVRLGIDINGHVFATYSKLDSSDASAAYADAVAASEEEWIWVAWEDGLYTWGTSPEPIKDPVWPVHRTPDDLLDAMLETRTITDIHHPLIERIVLARV